MERFEVTNFASAPTAYRAIMAAGFELKRRYQLQIRHMSSAGEPLNPEVVSWFKKEFGVTILDCYGLTEVAMLVNNYPFLEVKPGSMGKPCPGFDVKLLDETGREVEGNEVGLIATKYHPYFISHGYWRQEEKWQELFVSEGWFSTGDLARKDEDGYYFYVGRSDDIISSAGYRIGPFEIESIMLEHPAVRECAAVPKPDPLRGEIVKAFVALKEGYTPSPELAEEIKTLVKERLARHAYPREIEFIEEIPKTESGKIKRRDLRGREARL